MNEELLVQLNKYKDFTQRIIDTLEGKDYDLLNELFQNREKVIDKIGQIEYTSQQFKEICETIALVELEEKMQVLLKTEYTQKKEILEKFMDKKNVKKVYTQGFPVDSIYFNKKI